MSTFGKVLIFLNGLVAIVLLFLVGADYSEFRAARYAVFRHELVLTGLPVDQHEAAADDPDEPLYGKLPDGEMPAIFQGAEGGPDLGGAPVKSVIEELDRVQQKVRANIDAQPNPDQKRQKIRGYLLMQAKNMAERIQLDAKIRTAPIDELVEDLNRRFAQVKSIHQPYPAKSSAADRANLPPPNWMQVRFQAAELLVNLSNDPLWWERLRVVLGFDAVIHGLDTASHVMAQLAADVKEGILRDQGTFVGSYLDMVQQLTYETENLYQANKRLGELRELEKQRMLEVAQRTTEVEKNRAELADITAATNTEVAKLEAIQRDLFALQQRLGLALEASRSLEQQLRQRSGGR